MACIFDEEILRAPLRAMTPDERAQYTLGFIELVAMPYGRHRESRDLYMAIITVADGLFVPNDRTGNPRLSGVSWKIGETPCVNPLCASK